MTDGSVCVCFCISPLTPGGAAIRRRHRHSSRRLHAAMYSGLVACHLGRRFGCGFGATVLFQVRQGAFNMMARGPMSRSLLLQLRHSLLALFGRQRAPRVQTAA